MLLVTAAEMRALDREVIEQVGVPGVVLMDAAGRGVADVMCVIADPARARVVVYAGAGNNGGDGFVVARHLANRGAAVEVVLCAPAEHVKGDALIHLLAAERSGVPVLEAADADGLARAAARTAGAGLVVDALFGTGLTREVTGHLAQAIEDINAHRGIKIAVDIPSGLDSDRGVPLGACVRADHTVTFAFAKRGLVSSPGFTFVGKLHVVDIGIPERLARARGVRAELLDASVLAPLLGAPDPLGHKGTHGHLLLLAGSSGKTGAALLAGRAALRSGAGLCTVAAPRDMQPSLDGRVPELMTAWYGSGPVLDAASVWNELSPLIEGKRAIAAGPGMPPSLAMREVLGSLCRAAAEHHTALVLDADALNHLAADPSLLSGHASPERVVLTPHPGEAARLLGLSTAEVQADRSRCAAELAQRFNATVALKGARTVVAAPDGRLGICPAGNPGLGTGGTGDVLTGCTGALLARGLDGFAAATCAVFWHATAGDRVAAERGAIGITAGDVADALPGVLHSLTN